ncbi:General alpha-glucoside permease [Neolecta irregularis DAH-3]|uniref:General alpha-glucoside permease n=1 Tax=Neolecta irregularis (strain DAH-3) TaxID=1198029 RepID=A0A1U7LWJ5_NEOID|nr:General alpha-glucoside permease [Neolecta irregularis DAH-3]|eukprot:OLL26943.1 General alpha-glucoside permease [Neolecta irregularis DAH-3]
MNINSRNNLSNQDESISLLKSSKVHVRDVQHRSFWYLFLLSLALGGVQFAWATELAYVSPYLLSLGLPKPVMSLVWIAGPLSGIIMQPLIGQLSDKSRLKWGKRRPFIIGGCCGTVLGLLLMGRTKDIVGIFRHDDRNATIILAVFGLYLMDFSVNAIMASSRALIVDAAPHTQQDIANSMVSRLVGVGNVLGYLSGYIDLPRLFPRIGKSQFEILCLLSSIVLIICVTFTCFRVKEVNVDANSSSNIPKRSIVDPIKQIIYTIFHLPRPIRDVCVTQFFSWIGWFPFLIYCTAWIGQIYVLEHASQNGHASDPDWDKATRTGSFALLLYALVALLSSIVLPTFVAPDGIIAIKGLTLSRLWTLTMGIFAVCMFSTFFITTVSGATIMVSFCGIPWALTLWAPFALISKQVAWKNLDAGVVLGVHNIFISMPQVISTLISSLIFRICTKGVKEGGVHDESFDWILRSGGLATCVAIILAIRLDKSKANDEV